MQYNRFIFTFHLDDKKIEIADPAIVHQIRRVLRLKVGAEIFLSDGASNEMRAKIIKMTPRTVTVEAVSVRRNVNESLAHVILYAAILKKENFDFIVQKATEVGVKEIVPIRTSRTVKLEVKKHRLEKIIKESAEQSGRGIVPVLHEPLSFTRTLLDSSKNDANIIFEQSGVLFAKTPRVARIGVFVGPEGGWGPDEIEGARMSRFSMASLGTLTLRAETAAVIASWLVVNGR